jgi:methionine-rich copper-binding protein CopC
MSTQRHRPVPRGALRAVLLAAVAGALGVLATAVPAGAHAELVSSDPAQGSTARSLPTAVTLTFSEPVRTPAFVEVTAPDGTDIAQGDPRIVDDELTQRVAGPGGGGGYAVAYRITSADGHAISGTVRFTVEGPAPTEQEATGQEATGQASQPPAASAPATPEADPAAAEDESGGIGTTQLLLLLGVLAVGLVAVGIGTQRALRRSATMVEERRGGRAPRR